MSQRALAIAVAVSLSVGAVWYFSQKDTRGQTDGNALATHRHLEQSVPPASSSAHAAQSGIGSTSPSADRSARSDGYSGYRWRLGDPGIAADEADARWLGLHGYPDPEVEMRLRTLPLPALRTLAASGNQAAQSILAYRSARDGAPPAEVRALLSESAKAGSVYALKTAGDIHLMVEGYQDPALANAYYMLQARAGDQAGFVQGMITDNLLDPEQRLRARVVEQALWKELQLSSRGDSPARPGYQDFLDRGVAADTE